MDSISSSKVDETVDENEKRNLEIDFGNFSSEKNERTRKWLIIFG